MLGEGRWDCAVDEKDRFQFPAKIRDKFGTKGTWAFEPSGQVILYPATAWQEILKGVEDKQQFRLVWQPQDEELDPYGRMRIPTHIKELGELRQRIMVVSMDYYLKILNTDGIKNNPNKQKKGGKTMQEVAKMQPFASSEEAERFQREEKDVIYLGYNQRRVVGKFKGNSGGIFSFVGKDEHGVIVPIHQEPYWKFYPGE